MKAYKVTLAVLAATILVFGMAQTVAAQGTGAVSKKIPWWNYVYNDCTGEWVTVGGILHVVTHQFEDSSGGIHLNAKFNFQRGTAVGELSGEEYRVIDSAHQQEFNLHCEPLLVPEEPCEFFDPPIVFTYTRTAILIAPGSKDNSFFHVTFHVIMNAIGDITTEVDNFKIECR